MSIRKKIVLQAFQFELIVQRLAVQLLERNDLADTCLIGIQPRGGAVLKRLVKIIEEKYPEVGKIEHGLIDNTFYRDDFRRKQEPLKASRTEIDFIVEDKHVILVDDVLYTGRSLKAAINALQTFGRPSEIELLVLVDRRCSRHIPLNPNYYGLLLDTLPKEKVIVEWAEIEGRDQIYIVDYE